MNGKITKNLLAALLLLVVCAESKIYFSKDLVVNGTLKAQYGEFEAIQVSKKCNVDDLLSVDSLESDIVDTKELYLDVLQPTNDTNKIVIQGNMIIEDSDDSDSLSTITTSTLAQKKALVQKSMQARVNLMQVESEVLSSLPQDNHAYSEESWNKNWQLVANDDFNDKYSIQGWSFSETSFCTSSHDSFLGGHCILSNQEVSKSVNNLPPHKKIMVIATLHFIDNWQGETALVSIDDNPKWLRSITAHENSMNVCGGDFNEAAFNVPVMIESPHTQQSVKISFKTNIAENPCIKSLGIDNVEIYVK